MNTTNYYNYQSIRMNKTVELRCQHKKGFLQGSRIYSIMKRYSVSNASDAFKVVRNDLGAFCWEKLVKFRLLSSDFRIFPNMGLFLILDMQYKRLICTYWDRFNKYPLWKNISGLFRFSALNVAFQNRRKMQIYGLFNLVFKPYVVCGQLTFANFLQ